MIDACRLRWAERYKACVDDMPFDCPLRPRAEGVEIGFYLIITVIAAPLETALKEVEVKVPPLITAVPR